MADRQLERAGPGRVPQARCRSRMDQAEGRRAHRDPDRRRRQGRPAYGAKTTPHMYVIDPKGKLRYAGAIDDKRSRKADVKTANNYVAAARRGDGRQAGDRGHHQAVRLLGQVLTQAYGGRRKRGLDPTGSGPFLVIVKPASRRPKVPKPFHETTPLLFTTPPPSPRPSKSLQSE